MFASLDEQMKVDDATAECCVCCCGCIWHAPLRASQGQDYEARRSVASDRNRLDCRYVPKRKAWRIHALAEGGLSERAGRRALEIANDADLRLRFRHRHNLSRPPAAYSQSRAAQ